jgi:hypothetical protein
MSLFEDLVVNLRSHSITVNGGQPVPPCGPQLSAVPAESTWPLVPAEDSEIPARSNVLP